MTVSNERLKELEARLKFQADYVSELISLPMIETADALAEIIKERESVEPVGVVTDIECFDGKGHNITVRVRYIDSIPVGTKLYTAPPDTEALRDRVAGLEVWVQHLAGKLLLSNKTIAAQAEVIKVAKKALEDYLLPEADSSISKQALAKINELEK